MLNYAAIVYSIIGQNNRIIRGSSINKNPDNTPIEHDSAGAIHPLTNFFDSETYLFRPYTSKDEFMSVVSQLPNIYSSSPFPVIIEVNGVKKKYVFDSGEIKEGGENA